jgi:adenosylcobinamide-phosphate synthase
MNRSQLLALAYILDQALGDPEWFPHPVRLIGHAITRGERAVRRPDQPPAQELIAGAALTAAIVSASYILTGQAIRRAHRRSTALGAAMELLLAWTTLAARNLQQEASAVLDAPDLIRARIRLARIVGRDTASLNPPEISRAVIETVAESTCDGVIAPLFYLALGGVPLAMAYKAVNTLESMIGHADNRYFYFGKAAARLDDAANFIPSRLTAIALCAAAALDRDADADAALSTWRRDHRLHKSPNAGQPESAISGALRVQLGGINHYAGEKIETPAMGREFAPATPAKARHAMRLASAASLIAVLVFAIRARRPRV